MHTYRRYPPTPGQAASNGSPDQQRTHQATDMNGQSIESVQEQTLWTVWTIKKVEADGSAFELQFDAPVVGWKPGAYKDEHAIESQNHEIQLQFAPEAS